MNASTPCRRVFVTGATGNVGREVVRALLAKGIQVRAGDRQPDRLKALFGDTVESVRFDYADKSTFVVAQGVDGVFLLRPPAISDTKHTLIPFVDESRRLGVRHVVFLSVAGADTNPIVPHHAVERHLISSAVTGWTILRPGFFAQNLGDAYRRDIVEDARIYVPAGQGKVAFVDVRDLAEVSAMIFADPTPHEALGYTLTGGEALDFGQVTSRLTEVLGRPIRYEPASIFGYAKHLHGRKMPWAQVAVQTVLHTGLRFGQAASVDPTLERLLGRKPTSLRVYAEDHVALWR